MALVVGATSVWVTGKQDRKPLTADVPVSPQEARHLPTPQLPLWLPIFQRVRDSSHCCCPSSDKQAVASFFSSPLSLLL